MDPSRKGTYTFALLTVSVISFSLLMYILGEDTHTPLRAPWPTLAPTLSLFSQHRKPETKPPDQRTPLPETSPPDQGTPLPETPPSEEGTLLPETEPPAQTPSLQTSPRAITAGRLPEATASSEAVPVPAATPPSCLPNNTKLVTAEAVLGAAQVVSGSAQFLPAWIPRKESYLVMECNSGRMSNRIYCIQVHLLLAGLLNRTLIVDSAPQRAIRNDYDWSLLVHAPHLRACFGPPRGERVGGGAPVVLTSAEYQEMHGGERLKVDALACWHTRCNVNWRRVSETMTPTDVSESIHARSFSNMVHKYSKLDPNQTIIVGDLFNAYRVVPKQFWNFGDLPFARKKGCPDALAISPHPEIVAAAKEWVRRRLGGEPFLGIHWRSKDFGGLRICLQEEYAKACLKPDRVARCAASAVRELGFKRVVLCSDGTAAHVQALASQLSKMVGGGMEVFRNPAMEGAAGEALLGPSHEGAAMFQKVVLAHSTVFLGTLVSTFSMDIERLRVGWGMWNCRDHFLCEGDG